MTKCCWIGEGEGCESDSVKDRSYCQHHVWLVYQEGTARARRHKELRTVDDVRLLEQLFNEAVEELVAEGEL